MTIERLSIFGNDNIGVYIFANDRFAVVPKGVEPKVISAIKNALGVEVIECKICDTIIIGVMVAGNNNGILLPRTVREDEFRTLKNNLDAVVEVLPSHSTALGNVILANDRFALVHPELEDLAIKVVKDVLNVDVERGTIASIPTVGSAAVITNKGGLVHPDITPEEANYLSSKFGVQVDVGTVNFGVSFIRTGLVANSRGAIVGDSTTGPEIMRIQQALKI